MTDDSTPMFPLGHPPWHKRLVKRSRTIAKLRQHLEQAERELREERQERENLLSVLRLANKNAERRGRQRDEAREALDFIASDATIVPAGCPEPWRSTIIEWVDAANHALRPPDTPDGSTREAHEDPGAEAHEPMPEVDPETIEQLRAHHGIIFPAWRPKR